MGIDSVPLFESRCLAAGLTDDHVAKMVALGWSTFGDFAFASAYTPGMADDQAFVDDIVVPVLGDAKSPLKSKLRRILAEAFTIAAADQRRSVERPKEGEPARMLSKPDRKQKYDRQVAKLGGLELTGQLECANQLIDRCVQMYEADELKYIPWSDCACKNQELLGVTRDKGMMTDENGFIKSVEFTKMLRANMSTDLRIKYAITRRGLAFDQAMIMSLSSSSSRRTCRILCMGKERSR